MDILQIIVIALILILILLLIGTQSKLNNVTKQLPNAQSIDSISQRILDVGNSSRQSFESLAGKLGELSRAMEQMMEVGKSISSIEDLLKL